MVFTVRNSGGHAPWATIEHVVFRDNVVRHSAGGVNILGSDNIHESRTASDIAIVNNLFEDIDHHKWGGNGLFLMIGNGPSGVTIDHNTILQTSNVITVYGGKRGAWMTIPGFRFTNNVARHNAYGIFGNGVGIGTKAIDAYFPDAVITNNVLAGGPANQYPSGNFFPSLADTDGRLHRRRTERLSPRPSKRLQASGDRWRRRRRELRRAHARPGGSRSVSGSSRRCSLIL